MNVATGLLQERGWHVQDVSRTCSYDLLCTRPDEARRYVEVKGTTSTAERIVLTAAEVAFAREHRSAMLLIVVHGIALGREDGGGCIADGGEVLEFEDWAPELEHLSPISFHCRLPDRRSGGCHARIRHRTRD